MSHLLNLNQCISDVFLLKATQVNKYCSVYSQFTTVKLTVDTVHVPVSAFGVAFMTDSAAPHLSLHLLQLGHLLLQPLQLRPQLLLPLTRPLGLVPRPLQLRLQALQLQVRQCVQTAGALQRWPAAF